MGNCYFCLLAARYSYVMSEQKPVETGVRPTFACRLVCWSKSCLKFPHAPPDQNEYSCDGSMGGGVDGTARDGQWETTEKAMCYVVGLVMCDM